MPDALSLAVLDLAWERAVELAERRAQQGEDPLALLDHCRRGMTLVGERFEKGGYFLSELLLSAEIFKATVEVLEPHLAGARAREPLASVLLATMRGDIHDLGKNLLATLLRAHGFAVHDLGVDVAPAVLLEKVAAIEPDFVGFSALITMAFDNMKQAAEMLAEAGLRERLKLLLGGGVTTPELKDYIGADFQTLDATRAVAYCVELAGAR